MAKATDTDTAGGSKIAVPAPALPAMLAKRIPASVGYARRKMGEELNANNNQVTEIWDTTILMLTERHNKKPDTVRKRNVMLYGPTGTGKTELVLEFCAKTNKPLVTVMPAMRPEHLVGQFIEDAEGKLVFQKGALWMACEIGNCVIYFDEINRLHEDVVPMLYPLLDRRRQLFIYEHGIKAIRRSTGEYLPTFDPSDPDQERWEGEVVVDLPADVLIMASYNPGYAGTNQLNEAIRNRFEVSLEMDYSEEVEAKIIQTEAIRKLGADLRNASLHQGQITTPVSTNQLRALEENIKIFGLNSAISMFFNFFEGEDERRIVRDVVNTKYLDKLRVAFGYLQPKTTAKAGNVRAKAGNVRNRP